MNLDGHDLSHNVYFIFNLLKALASLNILVLFWYKFNSGVITVSLPHVAN